MKTKILLLSAVLFSQISEAQWVNKINGKKTKNAEKETRLSPTEAKLYVDSKVRIPINTIDGSSDQYSIYFPITQESISTEVKPQTLDGKSIYSVKIFFSSSEECFAGDIIYDRQYETESLTKLAKKVSFINEVIEGNYLNPILGNRLNDCGWPEGIISLKITLESKTKSGATLIISEKNIYIISNKRGAFYKKYKEQVIDSWADQSISNTMSDSTYVGAGLLEDEEILDNKYSTKQDADSTPIDF